MRITMRAAIQFDAVVQVPPMAVTVLARSTSSGSSKIGYSRLFVEPLLMSTGLN